MVEPFADLEFLLTSYFVFRNFLIPYPDVVLTFCTYRWYTNTRRSWLFKCFVFCLKSDM